MVSKSSSPVVDFSEIANSASYVITRLKWILFPLIAKGCIVHKEILDNYLCLLNMRYFYRFDCYFNSLKHRNWNWISACKVSYTRINVMDSSHLIIDKLLLLWFIQNLLQRNANSPPPLIFKSLDLKINSFRILPRIKATT